MKQRIAVIGGAITGPACALAFRQAGYEVVCHEARDVVTTTSAGVLGLRHWNLNALADMGISRESIVTYPGIDSLRHTVVGREVVARKPVPLPSMKATWSVLHRALDEQVGDIRYGERITGRPDADLIVHADGIGSAGRRRLDPERKFHYAGYAGFRGISDMEPEFMEWAVFEEDGQFLMNVVPTVTPSGNRLEWTIFLPWPYEFPRYNPKIQCDDPTGVPCNKATMIEFHALTRQLVPPYQMSIIEQTTGPVAAVSIGDWDAPQQMVYGDEIVIGDALCAMRPHTSMSANLGLGQGMSLPRAFTDGNLPIWEASWLADVTEQHTRGASMGRHYALTLTAGEQMPV